MLSMAYGMEHIPEKAWQRRHNNFIRLCNSFIFSYHSLSLSFSQGYRRLRLSSGSSQAHYSLESWRTSTAFQYGRLFLKIILFPFLSGKCLCKYCAYKTGTSLRTGPDLQLLHKGCSSEQFRRFSPQFIPDGKAYAKREYASVHKWYILISWLPKLSRITKDVHSTMLHSRNRTNNIPAKLVSPLRFIRNGIRKNYVIQAYFSSTSAVAYYYILHEGTSRTYLKVLLKMSHDLLKVMNTATIRNFWLCHWWSGNYGHTQLTDLWK